MGNLTHLFGWGLIPQALALIHFYYRRPDTFWIWVIIFFGPLGALAYMFMEVVPDLGQLRGSFQGFSRRSRINQLASTVLVNPSIGNYEDLADLYLDEKKYARARKCYDKAIGSRLHYPDPIYRRGIAEIFLRDFTAAVKDLEFVTAQDPKYDFHRAIALLAHAHANTGEPGKADALFRQATEISTSSETYINYATFLESQKRTAEAREWADRILVKKPTMPRYLRRRERPWFRQASALLKRAPK